ncbi:prepilin-type N-terminal cleavage/methylation domain-containing protein [Cerasicoccus maritimus]|uniref:prepilin-type N-terminal cleavage/methylation domain-containing protein n=1 Tax=Cerasicoccus maritimus TaxID=490089 RepID=UPI002852B3ED|nr:prepilin-type N-terminal cleavage/methylation domain-containing protein [Cerasicoccus maritimus]
MDTNRSFQGHHRRSRMAGFTLIEVLLVVGLSSLLLTAAVSLVFGLMSLKTSAEGAPQRDEHIANVRRFMEYAFAEAQPIENLGDEGGEAPEDAVSWRQLPGLSGLNEMALAFRLPGKIPLLSDNELYAPEVDCYLRFVEDEGLYLYWQSDAMASEDTDDLRRSLVSPLVTKLEYLWYDENDERWDVSEEMEDNDEGENTAPQFIRLSFGQDKKNKAVTALLLLPPSGEETPRL